MFSRGSKSKMDAKMGNTQGKDEEEKPPKKPTTTTQPWQQQASKPRQKSTAATSSVLPNAQAGSTSSKTANKTEQATGTGLDSKVKSTKALSRESSEDAEAVSFQSQVNWPKVEINLDSPKPETKYVYVKSDSKRNSESTPPTTPTTAATAATTTEGGVGSRIDSLPASPEVATKLAVDLSKSPGKAVKKEDAPDGTWNFVISGESKEKPVREKTGEGDREKEKPVTTGENKEKPGRENPGRENPEKTVTTQENKEKVTRESSEKSGGNIEIRVTSEANTKPEATKEKEKPLTPAHQEKTTKTPDPSPPKRNITEVRKPRLPPPLKTSTSPPPMPLAAATEMDEDFDLPVILDPKTPSKTLMVPGTERVKDNDELSGMKKSASQPVLASQQQPGAGGLRVNGKQNGRCPSPHQTAAVAALGKSLGGGKGQANGQAGAMESSTDSIPMDQVLRDEANFIQNVSQFYNQEDLSDVVLKVGAERYYSHRFVLAKSSEYFRTMLYEHGWNNQSNEVELEETPECQAVFDKFLRYLYTAEISISTMSAVGILCLADKYFVPSLKELCCQYMIDNSRSPKVRNALNWYSWAKALHLEPLLEQCTKTIAWNFNEIITSSEWVNMDVEFVFSLYSSSELVVPNEYAMFQALSSWLLQESRARQLKDNAARLLPLIRFPQLLVSQLYEIEQGELATREECQDLLLGLLSRAFRFRALCPSQASLGVAFQDSFYTPRDYTDLTVDNVRIQNTLRFGIQVDVKMFRGPVPSDVRDADWKVTYRKQLESWALQLYSHETAMINGEARIQASVIIYNEQEKVIQVHQEPSLVCTRGSTVTINLTMDQPQVARNMALLIKPIAS